MRKEDLAKFVIGADASIYDAMLAINENWREMVLVEDSAHKILGMITDGDIRRGFLSGLGMQSNVKEIMTKNFKYVPPETGRAAVLDIMKARGIQQIPVLNDEKVLQGIHFLRDILGATVKPNAAIIMAGGKGTRLRPWTENCPKPMIKVAGRPILERIVLHLVGFGIRKIYISINYLGHMIEDYFDDGSAFGCSIEYLREESPLGTGGALSLLPKGLQHPLIVMNGDQVTQVDISKMLESHYRQKGEATIGIRHYEVEIPFGVIKEEDGKLIELLEKPTEKFLINTGIYILNPGILKDVVSNEEFPITNLFDNLLEQKRPVCVHYIDEDWLDVGRHDELRKANGLF